MARGFISGLLAGGIVSVLGAGVASVLFDPPRAPQTSDAAPAATAVEAPEATDDTSVPSDADIVRDSTAPQVAAPGADAAVTAGRDPAAVPEAGAPGDVKVPDPQTDNGTVAVQGDAPVRPGAQAQLGTPPAADQAPDIPTQPAPPPAPEVVDNVPEAPLPEVADAPSVPDVEAPETDEADVEPAQPADEETVEVAPPVADPPREEAADTAQEEIAALPSAPDPASDTARPTIGRPATSIIDRDTAAENTPTEAAPAEPAEDTPPLVAYAAPFDDPGDRPLMSIVLIDSGVELTGGPIGLAALSTFPHPLTFAVDASLDDAVDRMTQYRAEGFEVMAMVDLPPGATATDTEVTLSVFLEKLPEVVAVMEGTGTGLQENRDAAEQVAEVVSESGHGVLFQSKGLNAAHKFAVRQGVPTALVFRDFDSAGQTPTVIRRFLDQAAFRASQEGGVVMVGRVRPDTISALVLWGLQDRAERVALAPVSAVLKRLAEPPQ